MGCRTDKPDTGSADTGQSANLWRLGQCQYYGPKDTVLHHAYMAALYRRGDLVGLSNYLRLEKLLGEKGFSMQKKPKHEVLMGKNV